MAETGDAVRGKRLFESRATQCHSMKRGEHYVGPSLFGVVGRPAGTAPGFDYSNAMRSQEFSWTPEVLFQYLENPKKYVLGTKMTFEGIKNAKDRRDVVAYLMTLK
eukprot:RCo021246